MDMESSSSTLSGRIWKHDVCISFYGKDSRNFADNLMAALQTEGLDVFMDDRELKIGDAISSQFLEGILDIFMDAISSQFLEEILDSKVIIIVLSRSYVSLPSLMVLGKSLLENIEIYLPLPIYYHLQEEEEIKMLLKQPNMLFQQPDENHLSFNPIELLLRKQISEWLSSCLKKIEDFKFWSKPETGGIVSMWGQDPESQIKHIHSSLTVNNELDEQAVTDFILKAVRFQLGYKVSDVADAGLVGMQPRVKKLEKLLNLEANVVQYVGICGIGGIGKTSLAKMVYDRISHQFDYRCFLVGIREVSKRYGLTHQQQLLCNIGKPQREYVKIRDVDKGALLIRNRLSCCKTLLVLDDVDHKMMIKALAGSPDWFGIGSRIIITTRDENIFKECGVDQVYKAELLNKNESLQFCQNILGTDYPNKELINYIVEYAKGLPLPIKSEAFKLLQREKLTQSTAMEDDVLLRILNKDLNRVSSLVLRDSFDALCEMEKEMFLHIACFFVGENINYVKEILHHLGFNLECGIKVLIDKSLITISNDRRIEMHRLVQELGRKIVRGDNKEPGLHSRLWLYDDFLNIQMTPMPTTKVEAIVLNHEEQKETPLKAEAFSKLGLLRLLIVHNVKFSGNLNSLSNELRYILWDKYPFTYLPPSFEPQELGELVMPGSNITQLWEGIKMLPKLRSINLRGSEKLIKTPDFSGVPNLERLDLEGCTALLQLHPSIEFLSKLTVLNLRNCISLVSIPNDLFGLRSLQVLNLAGCSELAKCLKFDPLRSSIEATLLSIRFPPFLAELLSFIYICFSQDISTNELTICCFIWLVYCICNVPLS